MPCPGRFTTGEETSYPLYSRLGGSQGQSGWVWKILPTPLFNPWTVHPGSIKLQHHHPHLQSTTPCQDMIQPVLAGPWCARFLTLVPHLHLTPSCVTCDTFVKLELAVCYYYCTHSNYGYLAYLACRPTIFKIPNSQALNCCLEIQLWLPMPLHQQISSPTFA